MIRICILFILLRCFIGVIVILRLQAACLTMSVFGCLRSCFLNNFPFQISEQAGFKVQSDGCCQHHVVDSNCFRHFGHQYPLPFYISAGRPGPRHQKDGTNIAKSSSILSHQHHDKMYSRDREFHELGPEDILCLLLTVSYCYCNFEEQTIQDKISAVIRRSNVETVFKIAISAQMDH